MNLDDFKNWGQLSFIIFLSLFLISCGSGNNKSVWEHVAIDANISNTPIYAQLDKQKELFSAFEKQDSLTRRTSDVGYSRDKKINVGEFNNLKMNNCRAYFRQSDTLFINIGIGTGFGGQGFIIKYKGERFYTETYFATDLIDPDMPDPIYKIVYQKLILDKPAYKYGDSLYGYIDFKSIETSNGNNTTEHWGKGYFRTRVTKL